MNTLNTNLAPEVQEWKVNDSKNSFLERINKLKIIVPAAVLSILLSSGIATAWDEENLKSCIARTAELGEVYEPVWDIEIDLELCSDQEEGLLASRRWQEASRRWQEMYENADRLNAATAMLK
jgi:hypothetical protein